MHNIVLHFMRPIVKNSLLLFSCPASKFTVICKLTDNIVMGSFA